MALNKYERTRINYLKFKQKELSDYNQKRNNACNRNHKLKKFNNSPAFYSLNSRYKIFSDNISDVESGNWYREVKIGLHSRDRIRVNKVNMQLKAYMRKN